MGEKIAMCTKHNGIQVIYDMVVCALGCPMCQLTETRINITENMSREAAEQVEGARRLKSALKQLLGL